MQLDYAQIKKLLKQSTILFDKHTVAKKTQELAELIDKEIEGEVPIFLSVMNGGMFFAAEVLKHINNPFILDYIHASRYGNEKFGASHIAWFRQPKSEDIINKIVYVFDDILDEGYTLNEINRFIINAGAKECKLVVLIDKDIGKEKPIKADYVGLKSPNHFLFGCGMDIYGLYRQLPDIYIHNQDSEEILK